MLQKYVHRIYKERDRLFLFCNSFTKFYLPRMFDEVVGYSRQEVSV